MAIQRKCGEQNYNHTLCQSLVKEWAYNMWDRVLRSMASHSCDNEANSCRRKYGVTCGIASCGHEPNRLLIEKLLEEFFTNITIYINTEGYKETIGVTFRVCLTVFLKHALSILVWRAI